METVLEAAQDRGLHGHLAALVHAWLAAHQISPELHRVLEKEFPFFDAPPDQSPADQGIFRRIRRLLEDHRDEVLPRDLDLATWIVLQTMESLIHAAVIAPSPGHPPAAIEEAIMEMLAGYLCGGQGSTLAHN